MSFLNVKAVVGSFNQKTAQLGPFSVIVKTDCETDGSSAALLQSFPLSPSVTSSPRSNTQHFLRITIVVVYGFRGPQLGGVRCCGDKKHQHQLSSDWDDAKTRARTWSVADTGEALCNAIPEIRVFIRPSHVKYYPQLSQSQPFCCLLAGTCFKLKCWSPVSFLRLPPATQNIYS